MLNLTELTSADLKNIVELVDQKEILNATLASINAELVSFESGQPAVTTMGKLGRKPGPAKAPRAARGSVKAAIIQLVQGAGATGITVKDIAARLGVKYNGVFTWFYNTGKKLKEIRKVGPGTYAWTGRSIRAPKPEMVTAPVAEPKPAAAPKPEKASAKLPKAKNHGRLKDAVIGVVQASGKAGIAVKDIAAKLGVKAPGIRVWFSTTGKKVKQIKKIGRGKYAWVG